MSVRMRRSIWVRERGIERENARLKKLLAESVLDNAILEEAASGNY